MTEIARLSVITGLIVALSAPSFGAPRFRADHADPATAELIVAAYKILELGYNCHAQGATLQACRAQLQTQINARVR